MKKRRARGESNPSPLADSCPPWGSYIMKRERPVGRSLVFAGLRHGPPLNCLPCSQAVKLSRVRLPSAHLSERFDGDDVVGGRVSLHQTRLRQGQDTLDGLLRSDQTKDESHSSGNGFTFQSLENQTTRAGSRSRKPSYNSFSQSSGHQR